MSIAALNGLINVAFGPLIIMVILWGQANKISIHQWLGLSGAFSWIIMFLLFDAWMYIWHRLNHTWFFLWPFHAMHHADTQMDSTTALRFHPAEIVFSNILNIGVLCLLGMSLEQFVFYKTALFLVIIFHHSNINLSERLDRGLKRFIVSPSMHRVHHSRKIEELNTNYGSVFSFWDRFFKSFCQRNDMEAVEFGLGLPFDRSGGTLVGMLKIPLAKKISQ